MPARVTVVELPIVSDGEVDFPVTVNVMRSEADVIVGHVGSRQHNVGFPTRILQPHKPLAVDNGDIEPLIAADIQAKTA